MAVEKYITIPLEVEAIQFTISTLSEVIAFTKCDGFQLDKKVDSYNCLLDIDGRKQLVIEGNYILKDSENKIKIIPENIFNKTYIKKE